MAEGTTAAAPAPSPTNGAKAPVLPIQKPPTPTNGNGAVVPTPVRGPDGKFTSASGTPPPAVDDDPEIDYGEGIKLKKSAAARELARARQASRLLTEAEKRNRAADEKERSYSGKMASYKADLGKFFEDAGMTPEEAAQATSEYIYERQVKPSQMTEEQRKLAAAEKRLAEYEGKEKTAAEEKEKAEQQRILDDETNTLHDEILRAAVAGKIPGAGPDDSAADRANATAEIASIMERALKLGTQLTVDQAVGFQREIIGRKTRRWLLAGDIAEYQQMWGPADFKAIAKKFWAYGLAVISPKAGIAPRPAPIAAAPKARTSMTPQQYADWLKGKR